MGSGSRTTLATTWRLSSKRCASSSACWPLPPAPRRPNTGFAGLASQVATPHRPAAEALPTRHAPQRGVVEPGRSAAVLKEVESSGHRPSCLMGIPLWVESGNRSIDRSLFIHSRGALKKELLEHLRRTRGMCRSRHHTQKTPTTAGSVTRCRSVSAKGLIQTSGHNEKDPTTVAVCVERPVNAGSSHIKSDDSEPWPGCYRGRNYTIVLAIILSSSSLRTNGLPW